MAWRSGTRTTMSRCLDQPHNAGTRGSPGGWDTDAPSVFERCPVIETTWGLGEFSHPELVIVHNLIPTQQAAAVDHPPPSPSGMRVPH